jgi:hypothetical protein
MTAVYRAVRLPSLGEVADAALPVMVLAEHFAQFQRLHGTGEAALASAREADLAVARFRRLLVRLQPFLSEVDEGDR